MILAIDGPGGAGKSTVASLTAQRLGDGWRRLDTGAIYRAVTAAVLDAGVDVSDAAACAAVAAGVDVRLEPDGTVRLDGRDVTATIRSPRVTGAVSAVSAHPEVRRLLQEQQRSVGATGNWVVEGRDIGTVVFPEAPLKIYLTASPRERARRRAGEVGETDVGAIESQIERRDVLDSTREDSPLRPAGDAITLDTTGLSVEEVVERVVELWRLR